MVIFLYRDVGGAVGVVLSCVGVVWWFYGFLQKNFYTEKPHKIRLCALSQKLFSKIFKKGIDTG